MALDVLVLRGLGLGDLLTAVPALRALRRAFPRHRLVLAAPRALADLMPLIGAVDEVLDVAGPGPVPFKEPRIAVNLHGRGPQSIEALRETRPARLLSYEVGPPWPEDVHEVRRWCDLLEWYGIDTDPTDLLLGRGDLSGPVVVHPGAAAPARRWPPERFARVIAGLGRDVVITGNAAERVLAERVAAEAGLPASTVLAGRTSLGELAEVVRSARLVISGDTGVAHLATAFSTPSVVLFGPVAPALWGPPDNGPHIPLWAGRTGDSHGELPDPGLLEIEVPDVENAARGLLEVSV